MQPLLETALRRGKTWAIAFRRFLKIRPFFWIQGVFLEKKRELSSEFAPWKCLLKIFFSLRPNFFCALERESPQSNPPRKTFSYLCALFARYFLWLFYGSSWRSSRLAKTMYVGCGGQHLEGSLFQGCPWPFCGFLSWALSCVCSPQKFGIANGGLQEGGFSQ